MLKHIIHWFKKLFGFKPLSQKAWYKFPGKPVEDLPYYRIETPQIVIPIYDIINGITTFEYISDLLIKEIKKLDKCEAKGTLYIMQDITVRIEQKGSNIVFSAYEIIGFELDS